jgi:hypothetical protein
VIKTIDGESVRDLSPGNNQYAPYPTELGVLVVSLVYKPGWEFELTHLDRGQGSVGLTLNILITTQDSYDHDVTRRVMHYFPVPPAAYDVRSWQHWLLEQVLLVERHEACEFFTVDGIKPYAPSHGFGQDPYLVREIGTELDQKTSFRNEINP